MRGIEPLGRGRQKRTEGHRERGKASEEGKKRERKREREGK